MSRSNNKRPITINRDDQPSFTTPRMVRSKRTESRLRLNRMTSYGKKRSRHRREFNSGVFTVAILGVLLILLFSFMGWLLLHKNAQAVTVNDERVAYIRDIKMTSADFNNLILAKLKEKTGNNVQLKETVTLVPVHVGSKKINKNMESVLTNLCNTLTYKQEAAAITVNGEKKVILATQEEAQSLLDQILAIYKPEDDPEVVEVDFVDDVQIESEFVEENEVMSTVKASDILRSYTTEPKVYTVKSGDSFSGIAAQADMTDEELLEANPSITRETMHKLQIGQEINITVPVPVLSVKVVKEYKEEQDIDIPTTTVENSNEYTTYQKVVSAGKKGKKEVVTHITYVNGYEESSEVVGENVLQEAQAQTVEVGTKNP